ncbi:MAG TPA: tetratricopeptide repeat protein [Myxococcales bacterium]|jgi:tetratricopeptide (TPR) repeat protein
MTALVCALLFAAPAALLTAGPPAASNLFGTTSKSDLAEQIETDLEAWDLSGAAKGLEALLHDFPDSPEAAYFEGRVLFEQGKYDEAVKAFETAASRADVPGSYHAMMNRGGQAVANEIRLAKAAAEETKGDHTFESEHFVFKTRPGKDTLLAPYALEALEKAYAGLTKDLGVTPSAKVRVEVYDSAKSLAHVSPLTVEQIKASGTIALCKYSRLMITSPKALLRGYPWLDTVSHEFVHYLVTQKGRNTVPIWLQEGLAKFLETRWRGPPGMAVDEMSLTLLQDAARKNTLIPFAKMHPSIALLPTQEQAALAFAEVEAVVRLLYQRGGQAALTELVSAMASGMGDEQAVAQAYGKSFAQFQADWRADILKAKAAHKNAHPQAQKKLVFKEDAKGKKEPPNVAQKEEPKMDEEAKRAGRLGEILFARQRWAGAAKEYARAREHLHMEVPIISRRYAFAEMKLGHFPEAEQALKKAVEREPDDETTQALYAHALIARKAWPEAREAIESGIAQDPFDPDLHASYVEVARGLSDKPLEEREKNALALAMGRGKE